MTAIERPSAQLQGPPRDRPEGGLQVALDWPIPEEVLVGGGTAIFVGGRAFAPGARITELSVAVDGDRQPVGAHSMPRLDYFRELHPGLDPYETAGVRTDLDSSDPLLHSYLSGFWAIVRIAPGEAREHSTLTLHAVLEGSSELESELARIRHGQLPPRVEPEPPAPLPPPVEPGRPAGTGPLVAICMATYNPPAELFARQLDSIRAQTHEHWICVISDDCSSPERYEALRAAVDGDPRFIVSRSPRRLGFYRNFERALALAPAGAEFVALADQDDRWHPDKLATLVAALGDARLVYSDARVVSRDGEPIAETWWSTRQNNHSDLLSLLVANSITGAASLFRRELLDDALPFPPAQFAHFHDHWLGLVALALGEIRFVSRPLYDYVQHGQASLGHAAANQMIGPRARLRDQRPAGERARMWRLHYFVDVCRLLQFAAVLELRCGTRMSARKRRALRRFTRGESSLLALSSLGARGARELLRRRPQTLGAEWMLFWALLWRRLLEATVRERPQRRLRLDAVPPPSLVQAPARSAPDAAAQAIADKIAPLAFGVSEHAPRRVNILIPTIDLEHFFGGYIAKLNLARRLAEHGLRVRVITVDPVGPLPRNWRQSLESYSGLQGILDRVEIELGRESPGIELSIEDGFIATTWWTAHIAHAAAQAVGRERFVYLIQEYEPFTFPMGTYAALAEQSYRFAHYGLFSSELLRGYFRNHRLGVYADGIAAGQEMSSSFQNAITAVQPPTVPELAARRARRLLFYARPEPHAARNMFELGVLALRQALGEGAFSGWELDGIGTVEGRRRIALGAGAELNLLPRSGQDEYGRVLREHDVGLALMYTPHPSLVPIEMASAGLVAVSNTFENKTPEAMSEISGNIVAAEPSVQAIAASLEHAARAADDLERRVTASRVSWSSDWNHSFDDYLLERIVRALGP